MFVLFKIHLMTFCVVHVFQTAYNMCTTEAKNRLAVEIGLKDDRPFPSLFQVLTVLTFVWGIQLEMD